MPHAKPAPERRHEQAFGQGIVRDRRGQDVPADKSRAQQSSSRRQRGESDPPLRRDDPPKQKIRRVRGTAGRFPRSP